MPNKQDSNLVGLAIAEESSTLGTLPASPHWIQLEPTSFSDFGNNITKVARKTINPTRKVQKGGVTDVDASVGFEHDLTLAWLLRVMRGFFFTDGNEAPTTDPLDRSDRLTASSVATATDDFDFDAAITGINENDLVFTDGFTNSANNGLHVVDDVSALASGTVGVTTNLTDEASPPAAARLRVVGHRFGTGDIVASTSGDFLYLTNDQSDIDFTDINIHAGDTVFIGGDAAGNQLTALGTGFARVVSVTATVLTLKDFTGTAAADDGVDTALDLFFPSTAFRDEPDADDIVRRSYQIERTLGEDDDGDQAEYVVGAIPNEMVVNLPEADKISLSFSYVGMDRETVAGTGTVRSVAGGATLHTPESEEFVNTSTDIYVARLVLDSGQTSLVGYLQNLTLTVSNGVSPNKAVGTVGAFDFSAGDFTVTGSVTAYFDDTTVMDAIRDNDDVALQVIGARDNEGFAIALPIVTLAGGQADVASDEPIMLPLDLSAAASSATGDVTFAYNFFAYLPDEAMPA